MVLKWYFIKLVMFIKKKNPKAIGFLVYILWAVA